MVHPDGSPVLSEQESAVVMYWHISDNESKTENSFRVPRPSLEMIHQAYLDHDLAYE